MKINRLQWEYTTRVFDYKRDPLIYEPFDAIQFTRKKKEKEKSVSFHPTCRR